MTRRILDIAKKMREPVRAETTVTWCWIAKRLSMRSEDERRELRGERKTSVKRRDPFLLVSPNRMRTHAGGALIDPVDRSSLTHQTDFTKLPS